MTEINQAREALQKLVGYGIAQVTLEAFQGIAREDRRCLEFPAIGAQVEPAGFRAPNLDQAGTRPHIGEKRLAGNRFGEGIQPEGGRAVEEQRLEHGFRIDPGQLDGFRFLNFLFRNRLGLGIG